MKSILVAIAILGAYLSCPIYARTFTEIKSSGVLKAAVDGNSPGFNYYANGELTGFEVDLAQTIADRLGLKLEWTVQPFNTLLIALQQGRFDLIADSHTVTPQRQQLVDFIEPHYCNSANIVTKINGPKTALDLKGKTVSVAVGTVYFDKLKTIDGIKKIMTMPGETDGLMALLNNRADAWVTERPMAVNALNSPTLKEQLVIGDAILHQVNAMTVAKGNKDLQEAVNQELRAMIVDGTYKELMHKYFSEDIACRQ